MASLHAVDRGTAVFSVDELVDWACAVPLEASRQAGVDRQRLVLIQLALHASPEAIAFPSAQRIADRICGYQRRTVRDALAALESTAVIERSGASSRSTLRWRLLASQEAKQVSPYTAQAGSSTGDMAGKMAGDMAGTPAMNRTEPNQKGAAPLRPGVDYCARHPDGDTGEPCGTCSAVNRESRKPRAPEYRSVRSGDGHEAVPDHRNGQPDRCAGCGSYLDTHAA